MKRIKGLDGIRGFAILFILVWHYYVSPLPLGEDKFSIFSFTWSGVDLFFVLSGFLIGGILLDNKHTKNLFKVFYLRRSLRIIPLYLLLLLPFILITSLDLHNSKLLYRLIRPGHHPIPIWTYCTFMQNNYMAYTSTFGPIWMSVTWSLAIEEQFYFLAPIIIRKTRNLFRLLICLIAFALIFRFFFIYVLGSASAPYVLLICRMDSLSLGILGALIVRNPSIADYLSKKIWILYVLLSSFGFYILLMIILRINMLSALNLTFGLTLISAFYLVAILIVYLEKNKIIDFLFSNKAIVNLGNVSYFAYLFHLIVLRSFHYIFLGQTPKNITLLGATITILSLSILLVLGNISYRFFEKPILNLGRKIDYE